MAPALDAPASNSTVRVRMIDTTTRMTIRAESFVEPVLKGHEILNITDVAFLVDNDTLGRRVLFDAGCRKDYWNLAPVVQKRLGDVIPSLKVDKDITEVLEEAGIGLDSIDSLVWSHHHWDHTGNPALFPETTTLVIGPGLNPNAAPKLLPPYPSSAKSPLLASDFANRPVTEILFSDPNQLYIGGFRAHDFFSDGSFYLLDTPGHAVGHMCGLARTTAKPPTFILLGGDICHFPGDLRPNPTHPLPDPIPAGVLDRDPYFPTPCPCSLFTNLNATLTDTKTPIYALSTHLRSAYIDPPLASQSVRTLRSNFDECPDVFVALTHDPALLENDALPILNKNPDADINAWKREGWKERLYWKWLNELPRAGNPGRAKMVEGFWMDGKQFDRRSDEQVDDGAGTRKGKESGKL